MNRISLLAVLCMAGALSLGGAWPASAETNYYHFWRTFQHRPAPNDANTYELHMEAARLSGVVGPFNIKTTAPPFATEYEGVSWSRASGTSAWHYVASTGTASYYGYDSNVFTNVVFDNVGWVTGTTNVLGQWGAYAWLLQNTLRFQSSTSDYYVSSLGKTSEVGSVLVGTLGDYCPLTTTTNTGPRWSTNYPGENGAMITNMQADTRAFYKLVRKMDLNANDGDADHDGIPNYADGFDWGTDPDDNQPGSFAFVGWPLLFSGYAHTQATLRFTYSASDPSALTLSNGVYTPAAGHLRLWKRNGYQRRNKAGAHTNAAGDFIPEAEMNPQAVFGPTGRMAMVYMETVAPASNQVLVFEIDPDGSNGPAGFACVDRIGTTIFKVDLELRNTGTIVAAPENEDYASEKAAAENNDQLGPLPIGDGRSDVPFKDNSYISPIMVIGTVRPDSAATLVFRWKRYVSARNWDIVKSTDGAKWVVTQYNKVGIPTPQDDTGDAAYNDPTPSVASNKIYIYDNSGKYLNNTAQAIGDYIYGEKDFLYRVDVQIGGSWTEGCSQAHVGQTMIVKKIASTGTVVVDWQGIENSNAIRTLDCIVTDAEVRAIVGGTLPIEIDPNANN